MVLWAASFSFKQGTLVLCYLMWCFWLGYFRNFSIKRTT
jgi:hypothetical protein